MTGANQAELKRRAGELLGMVRDIGTELNLRTDLLRHLDLDYSLDRDLGLDSLARMELLERVERRYGVSLSEKRLREIETIGDLLVALRSAPSYRGDFFVHNEDTKSISGGDLFSGVPSSAATLVDVLEWHVSTHPDRVHVEFYEDSGQGVTITYRTLLRNARKVAVALTKRGISSRDTVVIMLPTSEDYFYCFWGVLLAGCVPVPIYPPYRAKQLEDHLRRHTSILNNCRATALITSPESGLVSRLLSSSVPSLREILVPQDLYTNESENELPRPIATDTALIQYTSGSTGIPKGVVLTHANLLANIRTMGEHLGVDSSDVFVSWLPLYHDMGLIGAWLGTLYYSAKLVIMSPFAFLSRPARWLWAMHRYQCTITSAPNFAYELCLKRVEDDELSGLNLKSLRVVCNGAEFVSAKTVQQFLTRYAKYGLSDSAYMSVYGLAECSVGLAFPETGTSPRIDRISREIFYQSHCATPVSQDERNPLEFVACGQALPRHEIRIVDDSNKEVADRIEGRLQFRGPSATSGYCNNPEENKRVFHDSWIDSGDLAYRAENDFFITGRSKDIIIIGGRNLYPDELEEAVGEISGVRKGCVAAFGVRDPEIGTERLVLVAETREENPDNLDKLYKRINEIGLELVGSSPHDVWLAPPHTVLKTSSGKIRRRATRECYEHFRTKPRLGSPFFKMLSFKFNEKIAVSRRIVSIAFDYIYTVYLYFLMALVCVLMIPVLAILPTVGSRWAIMRLLIKAVTYLAGMKVSVDGVVNIPKKGSIIVANHCSYVDVFLLMYALRGPVVFVAKAELSRFWYSRFVCSKLGVEFVERLDPEQGLADARRLLNLARANKSILFFPEGTFVRRPGLLPFRTGAFAIAVEARIPVVPVVLRGTRRFLTAENWVVKRCPLNVTILPSLTVPASAIDAALWGKSLALRDAARKAMLAASGEPDLAGERVYLGDLQRNG